MDALDRIQRAAPRSDRERPQIAGRLTFDSHTGPEIIDKYVGSSEAQLRDLFASPPLVPPRPGDAEDVAQIAENNELHVVVLDEFDAIARVRSDGKKSDTATRDSVVNQLLVLMDGVAQLPVPTLLSAFNL